MHFPGSSPRLRGTLLAVKNREPPPRFIPAPAGNTGGLVCAHGLDPVHPRACGEHSLKLRADRVGGGSSPRLRGTLHRVHLGQVAPRFIPAPAGNTRAKITADEWRAVHPRACGEHKCRARGDERHGGSSPRLRGTRETSVCNGCVKRFIPAPAGNTFLALRHLYV